MKFRKFDRFDQPFSFLGLGTMRFPEKTEDGKSHLDYEKSVEIIRNAIDHQVNYIDTARPYHDGSCEKAVGMALADGYREKVYLATKLTPWQVKKEEDMEAILLSQLENLQTQYIDIYMLHYLNRENWNKFLKLHVFDFLERQRELGRIRYIGFSFHDDESLFREILDYYDWDICQIQLNILDYNKQATVRGLQYAGTKGIPVVIMEPLKGGMLVNNIPEEVNDIWVKDGKGKPPIDWCFQWLYHLPEVALVLSGINDMGQLEQNLDIVNNFTETGLSDSDLELINRIVTSYHKIWKVECTSCRYCLPCPHFVDIPMIFQYYNEASMFQNYRQSLLDYWSNVVGKGHSSMECTKCGLCMKKCPQALNIPALIEEGHRYLMNQGEETVSS